MESPLCRDLAGRIAAADPYSPRTLASLLTAVRQLHLRIPKGTHSDLTTKLEVSEKLLEHLVLGGAVTPEATVEIVSALVGDVEGTFASTRPEAVVLAPLPKKPDVGAGGLRMAGGKLLGQILVEMQVVTERDLQVALEDQRSTGTLLGDALVARGACSRRQVLHAVELQRGLQHAIQRRR